MAMNEADEILTRLRQEGITTLYHFTNVKNLSGIVEQGAMLQAIAEERKEWPPPSPGGNEISHDLDRKNGNWDKVSLSLTPNTPMDVPPET